MRVFEAPVSHLWGTLWLPAPLALSVSTLGCALPPLMAEWSSITQENKRHVRFLAFINACPPFSRCLFRAGPGPKACFLLSSFLPGSRKSPVRGHEGEALRTRRDSLAQPQGTLEPDTSHATPNS